MAITISGENNNDRILAQDGVIDSISGFNIAGIITASSFTGDLTGDVTGNLTGNVTGNINNTTLLLQTGGSERVRIASNGKVGVGVNPTNYPGIFVVSGDALICDRDIHSRVANTVANSDRGFKQDIDGTEKLHLYADNSSNIILEGNGGVEKLRIFSNGLVNIGAGSSTSGLSPLLHLHKNASSSSAYFHITNNDTGITNNDGFLLGINPSGDCLVFNKDSTPLRFATAGEERLRIQSNGVIIGRGELRLTQGTSSVSNGSEIGSLMYLHPATDNKNAKIVALMNAGSSGADLAFFTRTQADGTNTDGGEERLRIDSTGRVLIGHSSTPQAALSVAVVGSYGGSSTNTPFVYLCRDEDATAISGGESLGQILFASRDGYRGAVIEGVAEGAWSGSSSDGYLVFKTTPDNATVPTEKLRIASTGNVSIGTQNVSEGLLQVNGDITAKLRHGSSDMYGMLAGRKFDGNNAMGGYAIRYGSGYESPWIVGYNAGASYDNQITFGSMTTSDRSLETGVTKRMVIDMESGSVGIGTATIASNKKLDICNGIVSIQGTGSHDCRYEFVRSDTGAMGWIGIPNWNPAGLYIYAPTASSNEIAASYGGSAWNFFTGGSSTRKIRVDSGGRTLFRTNGSVSAPITDDNVPVQIAESTGSMCYFGANKGSSYGALFGYHTAYGGTVIRNVNTDDIVFYTNSTTERLRIDHSANTVTVKNAEFQVNNQELQVTSSNSYASHFNYQDNGSNYISFKNTGSTVFRNNVGSGYVMIVYGSGNIGAPSGNNIYNASDERLKENMVELTNGLDKIKKLKPYSFTWKKGFDQDLEGVTQYGFGAHQAKTVDEKLVEKFSENDIELDGETIKDPLRVNEKHVIPLLVKAIQEQQEQIEILKSEVNALKGS